MTEPSKVEPPKRKRRWFQFSLRSLLILMEGEHDEIEGSDESALAQVIAAE
jgi:hypothetical protein